MHVYLVIYTENLGVASFNDVDIDERYHHRVISGLDLVSNNSGELSQLEVVEPVDIFSFNSDQKESQASHLHSFNNSNFKPLHRRNVSDSSAFNK